jgi:hypothetical protein
LENCALIPQSKEEIMKTYTLKPKCGLDKEHPTNRLWFLLIRHESIDLICEVFGGPKSTATAVYDELERMVADAVGDTFWGLDLRYNEATEEIEKVIFHKS